MYIFNKIIALSKKIAEALLHDKRPIDLEESNLFDDKDKEYIISQLTKKANIKERLTLVNEIDKDADWKSVESKIEVPLRKLYWKYIAAASVLLIVSLTVFLSKTTQEQVIDPIIVNTNTILPGTDKATLTLANGEQVLLEKGNSFQTQNANSDGEQIVYQETKRDSKELTYNYLTIPRGGQFYVVLSDGTRVWLNSESQLKYPVSFIEGETRQVELVYGEAYFDVSSSTGHQGSKFKVLHQLQEIEVLGTEFNIKAYQDETNIYTTLAEGKVSVDYNGEKQFLQPSQQSNLNTEEKTIVVSQVDIYNEISWKDGVFVFEGKTLKEIVKVLSRWYDIDFVFEDKLAEEKRFNGSLNRKLKTNEILDIIKNFGKIKGYEIKDKTIIIK